MEVGVGLKALLLFSRIKTFRFTSHPDAKKFRLISYMLSLMLTVISVTAFPKDLEEFKDANTLTLVLLRLKCPYCPMEQNPSHAKQIYF